jgi:hypothetical protein
MEGRQSLRTSSGIYVEIEIQDDLDHVWLLTQEPAFHERWDLRFSRIHYLPRSSSTEPQQFVYETRIGFGLSIKGTGESIGQRASAVGDTTSSLKFASAIQNRSSMRALDKWRYVPGVPFWEVGKLLQAARHIRGYVADMPCWGVTKSCSVTSVPCLYTCCASGEDI